MTKAAPSIQAFFDEATSTVSYLVADPRTRRTAVIDPVLDYDAGSGEVDTRSVQAILRAAEAKGLAIEWALETHAHADHLSEAPFIKMRTGARIGIGEHIRDVQRIFRPVFNATDLKADGSDFDRLFGQKRQSEAAIHAMRHGGRRRVRRWRPYRSIDRRDQAGDVADRRPCHAFRPLDRARHQGL